jgi:hypothetical protein
MLAKLPVCPELVYAANKEIVTRAMEMLVSA